MDGGRVRLRGWEKSDADALLRWRSDEDLNRLLGPPTLPVSRTQQERFVGQVSAPDAEVKSFAIETLDGKKLIGEAGIRAINWMSRKAEFFIAIGEKDQWGRGLGTDAVRVVIRLAFEKMNLNRLFLSVLADNARAIRCYEKCGFKREGLLRSESYVDGEYRDVIVMGLVRDSGVPRFGAKA